jgi:hypothetical protein
VSSADGVEALIIQYTYDGVIARFALAAVIPFFAVLVSFAAVLFLGSCVSRIPYLMITS